MGGSRTSPARPHRRTANSDTTAASQRWSTPTPHTPSGTPNSLSSRITATGGHRRVHYDEGILVGTRRGPGNGGRGQSSASNGSAHS